MDKKRRAQTKPIAKVPSAQKARKRAKKFSIIATVSLFLIAVFIVVVTVYKITDFIITENSQKTNLPKLEISLADTTIEQIDSSDKNVKYTNNSAYKNNGTHDF